MKRILALLLSIVMAVSSLPLPALAAEVLPTEAPSAEEAEIQETAASPVGATEAPLLGEGETLPPQETTAPPIGATEATLTEEEASEPQETMELPAGATEAPAVGEEETAEAYEETVVIEEEPLEAAYGDVIASGTCGENLTWELTQSYGDEYKLTISGTGPMVDYEFDSDQWNPTSPWAEYRKQISYVKIGDAVTSIGDNAFRWMDELSVITIPNSVTRIGELAFLGCRNLDWVTMSDNVTVIGDSAFENCSALEKITIPQGVTCIGDSVFAGCTALQKIVIPEGVTTISARAFQDCISLASITIPQGVTYIGNSAFAGCTALEEIVIPEGVTTIGKNVFFGGYPFPVITIPESVTSIGNEQHIWYDDECFFENCRNATLRVYSGSYAEQWGSGHGVKLIPLSGTCGPDARWRLGLDGTLTVSGTGPMDHYEKAKAPWKDSVGYITKIVVEEGITAIGDYAFYDCQGASEIILPDSVTTIGDAAFDNCRGIAQLTIPESVTSIGARAFINCRGLTSLTLPGSLTVIPDEAFAGCHKLTDIAIPESVTTIGAEAFNYCVALTGITLPKGITAIADSLFNGCTALTSVAIPGGVTAIGSSAFSGCTALAEIDIPDSVTSIGSSAFSDCTALTAIDIPDGVTYIGTSAFSGCTGITSLVLPAGLTTLQPETFSGLSELRAVYLPDTIKNVRVMYALTPFYEVSPKLVIYTGYKEVPEDWNEKWNWYGKTNGDDTALAVKYNYPRFDFEFWVAYDSTADTVVIPECITRVESAIFDAPETQQITFMGTQEQWKRLATGRAAACSDGLCEKAYASDRNGTCRWALDGDGSLYVAGYGKLYGNWSDYKGLVKKAVVGEGITDIGGAFGDLRRMESIELPTSLEISGSFQGCENLKQVYISDLAAWCNVDFSGSYYSAYSPLYYGARLYLNGEPVTELVIPYGVTRISEYAFYYGSGIQKVVIPEGVTEIGKCAFGFCADLKEVVLPSTLTAIGDSGFNSTAVQEISLPRSLERIGELAFAHCDDLKTIVFHHGPKDSLKIGESAFYVEKTKATTVKVPETDNTHPVILGYYWEWDNRNVTWNAHHCMNGHVIADGIITPPTCTEPGLTGGGTCEVCGKEIAESSVLPALGHTVVIDSAAVAPTCTKPGWTEQSHCSVCQEVVSQRKEIPTLNHDFGDKQVLQEPTCTEEGRYGSLCSRCGETVEEAIPALGHAFGEDDIIQAPTCTQEGRFGCECSRCGETVEEAIPALGHTEVTDPAREPTCTEPGLTEGKHCSVCGEVLEVQQELAALGHEKNVVETVAPGCLTQGYTLYSCVRCGQTWQDDQTEAIGSHTYSNDQDPICDVCGYNRSDCIAAGNCGKNVNWILDKEYTLTITGTGAIPDYQSGRAPWLEYKTQIRNAVICEGITGIGNYAFQDCDGLTNLTLPKSIVELGMHIIAGCDNLTSLTIQSTAAITGWSFVDGCNALTTLTLPEGLTSIGESAFRGCSALTSLTLPESLTDIGKNAFYGCSSLTSLTLPENLTAIDEGAFYGCKALTELVIPEGTVSIGDEAFCECHSLTDLVLPEGLVSIGEQAFRYCRSLSELILPETLTSIGRYAFYYCSTLTCLKIPGSLTIIEPGVFSECEKLTQLVLPEGLTTIEDSAFAWCESLPELILPESLTHIGNYAFRECDSLTSVTIPKNVTYFGKHAFDANAMKEIRFEGSAPELPQDTFQYETLTVYYPGDDASWTEDVLQNYGGKITWLPHCGNSHVSVADSAVEPTCLETGLTQGSHCGECGMVLEAQMAIPALGHEETVLAAVEPSCTQSGLTEGKGCSHCGEVITPQEEIPALGHSMEDGLCSRCGQPATYVAVTGDAQVLGGKSVVLTAAIVSEDSKDNEITWSLAEEAQAFVKWKVKGNTLTVTALDVTELQTIPITASAGEDIALCEFLLTLVPQPKEVQLVSPGEDSIPLIFEAGGEFQLQLEGKLLPEGARSSLTWTSSNTKVVRVDETGMLYFTGKAGTAVITVKTENGVKATASFKVVETVSEVAIVGDPWLSLQGGESVTLKLLDLRTGRAVNSKNIRWSIRVDKGDPSAYATVNASGKLTAKKLPYQATFWVDAQVLTEGLVTAQATWDVTTYPAAAAMVIWEDADMATGQTRYFNLQNRTEMRLDASLLPEGVMEQEIQWTVTDKKEKYAAYRVEDNGRSLVITDPTGELGTVTFTAKSTEGSKKSATVKVQFGVFAEEVEVLTNEMFLHSGDSLTLNAQTKPEKVTKGGITWSLADPGDKAYVTLSGNKLKAKTVYAEHTVTLVATSKDGRASTTYDISIVPEDPYLLTLREENSGKNVTNDTVYVDLNREDRQVVLRAEIASGEVEVTPQWSYKDSGTASFREDDGKLEVTMLKAGTVKVTVKDGKQSATVTVKAANLAQSVRITTKNGKNLTEEGQIQVASGKTVDLKAILEGASGGKVSWSIVEGGQYAKLSSSGKLTAGKNITSTREVLVRAKALDGSDAEGEIRVYIKPLATGIHIYTLEGDMNRRSISAYSSGWKNTRSNTDNTWDMNENSGFKMYADVYPYSQYGDYDAAIQDVTWKSSNAKVASIDDQGQVTFHKPGTVTLTATAADGSGQKVSCKLTLIKRVTELQLEDAQVVGGKTLKLKPTVLPGDTTTKKFYWEIIDGDTAFAKIDQKGKLTTKKVTAPKTVTVRVWADDFTGVYADCVVTIYPKSQ